MKVARLYGYAAIAVVVLSVAIAFSIVGSPWHARAVRGDNIRVESLHNIMREIAKRYKEQKKLPDKLGNLIFSGYGVTTDQTILDPLTQEPYGYRQLGGSKYELSATFETDEPYRGYYSPPSEPNFLKHGKGRAVIVVDAAKPVDPRY